MILFLYLFEFIPLLWTKVKPQNRLCGRACPCSGRSGLANLEKAIGLLELSGSARVLQQYHMQRDSWVHVLANGKMKVKQKKEGKLTSLKRWKVNINYSAQIILILQYIIGSCFWMEFFQLSFSTFVYQLWSYTVHIHQLIKLSRFQNKSLKTSLQRKLTV